MGHVYGDRLSMSLDELCFNAENGSKNRSGKMGRKNYGDGDTKVFKSKNLETERRRREKLSARLLMLRSLVPIITNMNKATIIDDAITYIKSLQDRVESLSKELSEMEVKQDKLEEPKIDEIDTAEEMKKWGIQEEVRVTQIDGNKIWIKMIIGKKRGRFTKLMEAMNSFGIELIDTSATTMKGAFLLTASIQGMDGEMLEIQQTKELLRGIIRAT